MSEQKNWKARFALVALGQAVSMLGSHGVQFALIWWLAEQTSSPLMLGMAGLAALSSDGCFQPSGRDRVRPVQQKIHFRFFRSVDGRDRHDLFRTDARLRPAGMDRPDHALRKRRGQHLSAAGHPVDHSSAGAEGAAGKDKRNSAADECRLVSLRPGHRGGPLRRISRCPSFCSATSPERFWPVSLWAS